MRKARLGAMYRGPQQEDGEKFGLAHLIDLEERHEPGKLPPEARAAVHAGLSGSSPEERRLAAELATEIMDDDLVESVVGLLLTDSDEQVRIAAAACLGPALEDCWWCRMTDSPPIEAVLDTAREDAAIRALGEVFTNPGNPSALRCAVMLSAARARSLWVAKEVQPAFQSADVTWRVIALHCLAYFDGFAEEILEGLADERMIVRIAATHAAIGSGCDMAVVPLIDLIRGGELNLEVTLVVIRGFADFYHQAIDGFLAELADSDSEEIREAAKRSCLKREDMDADDLEPGHETCELCDAEVSFVLATETHGHRLLVDRNGQQEEFDVTLETCGRPSCGCANVIVLCHSVEPDGKSPRRASLDVLDFVASMGGDIPFDEDLSLHLAKALDFDQWMELYQFFLTSKQCEIEAADLDTLTITFPHDAIKDRRMVGYDEIFWWASLPPFKLDQQELRVDDLYCLEPACGCHDVILAVSKNENDDDPSPSAAEVVDDECIASIRMDTATGEWKDEQPSQTESELPYRLMAELARLHPDFLATLQERRRVLRQVSEKELNPVPTAKAPARVGRNAPCPCNSGKKYKRCCGK